MKKFRSRTFRAKAWMWIMATGSTVFVVGALLPALRLPSNCGGNTAASSACRAYVLAARISISDRSDSAFNFETAAEDDRTEMLDRLRRKSRTWLRNAGFYVRMGEFAVGPDAPKEIVVMCATPFDNVPQRRFGRAPMAHAVGYSNGKCGLISPEDFSQLELSEFQLIGGAPEKDVGQ